VGRRDENIEIFDSEFIDANVFEGQGVSFDQQKNLNQIIIGARGEN
jgi:hypothetical protein